MPSSFPPKGRVVVLSHTHLESWILLADVVKSSGFQHFTSGFFSPRVSKIVTFICSSVSLSFLFPHACRINRTSPDSTLGFTCLLNGATASWVSKCLATSQRLNHEIYIREYFEQGCTPHASLTSFQYISIESGDHPSLGQSGSGCWNVTNGTFKTFSRLDQSLNVLDP